MTLLYGVVSVILLSTQLTIILKFLGDQVNPNFIGINFGLLAVTGS